MTYAPLRCRRYGHIAVAMSRSIMLPCELTLLRDPRVRRRLSLDRTEAWDGERSCGDRDQYMLFEHGDVLEYTRISVDGIGAVDRT